MSTLHTLQLPQKLKQFFHSESEILLAIKAEDDSLELKWKTRLILACKTVRKKAVSLHLPNGSIFVKTNFRPDFNTMLKYFSEIRNIVCLSPKTPWNSWQYISFMLVQMLWCLVFVPFTSCCLPVLASFFQGQGMLPYFANFRLLAEFSTPCVNQR